MKKKVLALTLGLTMALSLAACGGDTSLPPALTPPVPALPLPAPPPAM